MAKKEPWHSIKGDRHHVCSECDLGDNIDPKYKREGTGDKPLCKDCEFLIDSGGC